MPFPSTAVFTALILVFGARAENTFAQGNGSNHSQNIQTNNGVSVQINVKQALRKATAASQIDERGWMRLLTPAHDQTPSNRCGEFEQRSSIPPNTLKIFYGSNVGYCMGARCDVVVGELGTKKVPIITVSKVKAGLMLDAKVFDKDGNIVASIVGDRPHLNKNFVSDFNRPDGHSLWVKDNRDEQILYVKLLNPNSLYLEGVFNMPDDVRGPRLPHTTLTISRDSAIFKPGINMSGFCMVGDKNSSSLILITEEP